MCLDYTIRPFNSRGASAVIGPSRIAIGHTRNRWHTQSAIRPCSCKPDNGYENSSRVFGDFGWEMQPPLSSSVGIQGPSCKLNKPGTRCLGWTVEIALPLADLAYNTTATVPPVPGSSYWRINFSRVEWHAKVEGGR